MTNLPLYLTIQPNGAQKDQRDAGQPVGFSQQRTVFAVPGLVQVGCTGLPHRLECQKRGWLGDHGQRRSGGWLAARRVDLSIQEEFSLTAPSGSGPAFDLKCKVAGVVRASRVAFIASPVGVLEFNSLSSPEEAEAAKVNLRLLSRGFRISDANGQFETLPSQSES